MARFELLQFWGCRKMVGGPMKQAYFRNRLPPLLVGQNLRANLKSLSGAPVFEYKCVGEVGALCWASSIYLHRLASVICFVRVPFAVEVESPGQNTVSQFKQDN